MTSFLILAFENVHKSNDPYSGNFFLRYATPQKILRSGIGLAQEIFSRPEKKYVASCFWKSIFVKE